MFFGQPKGEGLWGQDYFFFIRDPVCCSKFYNLIFKTRQFCKNMDACSPMLVGGSQKELKLHSIPMPCYSGTVIPNLMGEFDHLTSKS